jgi:hypothetical protein
MHLGSLLGNGLPSADLGLESVVSDKGAGSTSVVGLELVGVSSDGELLLGGVARSGVDTVSEPEMPSGLDLGHVVVLFLVLDVSGSEMDFVLVIGLVELVSVNLG